MRWLPIAVTCLAVAGCGILGPDQVVLKRLEVAPHKSWCISEAVALCLQVREPGEPAFGNLYDAPAGFDFEWGFEYVILIEERKLEEILADGASTELHLDQVVSKSAVPAETTFELVVNSTWLEFLSDSTIALVPESIQLDCAASDCSALLDSLRHLPRMALSLAFTDAPERPLRIDSWQSCEHISEPCPRYRTQSPKR